MEKNSDLISAAQDDPPLTNAINSIAISEDYYIGPSGSSQYDQPAAPNPLSRPSSQPSSNPFPSISADTTSAQPAASFHPAFYPSAQPPSIPIHPQHTDPLLPKITTSIAAALKASSKRSSKGTLTKNMKISGYIYMGLSGCVVILSILDLCLHFWVRYCGPRIGMANAYNGDQSKTLRDAKNEYCGVAKAESVTCGDICSNFQRLMIAGQVMASLGAFAIVLTFLSLLGAAYLMWGIQHRWMRVVMRLILALATSSWIAGTMVYVGLYAYIHDNTLDSSIGPGLLLAIVLSFLQSINLIMGLFLVSYLSEQGLQSRSQTMLNS